MDDRVIGYIKILYAVLPKSNLLTIVKNFDTPHLHFAEMNLVGKLVGKKIQIDAITITGTITVDQGRVSWSQILV